MLLLLLALACASAPPSDGMPPSEPPPPAEPVPPAEPAAPAGPPPLGALPAAPAAAPPLERLHLTWTDRERSRDSWSRTTRVEVEGDTATLSEAVTGSARRRPPPPPKTFHLTDAQRASLGAMVARAGLDQDAEIAAPTRSSFRSVQATVEAEVGGRAGRTTLTGAPAGPSGPPGAAEGPGESTLDQHRAARGAQALLAALRRLAAEAPPAG